MPKGVYKRTMPSSKKGKKLEEFYGKERAKKIKEKMSGSLKGRIPHNKGKTKKNYKPMQKLSEIQKINMKGKHNSPKTEFKKGIVPWMKGRKHTLKTRKKISMSLTGDKKFNGFHLSRLGKLRRSLKSETWKKVVFERYNYTCQITKERGGKLAVHHIYPFSQYPGLRFEPDNGIVILNKLHILFHQIYGKVNNDYEQLMEFKKVIEYDKRII